MCVTFDAEGQGDLLPKHYFLSKVCFLVLDGELSIRNKGGVELKCKKDCWLMGEHLQYLGWATAEVRLSTAYVKILLMRQEDASNILDLKNFSERTFLFLILSNHDCLAKMRSSSIMNLTKSFKLANCHHGAVIVTEGDQTQKFLINLSSELSYKDHLTVRSKTILSSPLIIYPEAISTEGIPEYIEPQYSLQVHQPGLLGWISLSSLKSVIHSDLQELREAELQSKHTANLRCKALDLKTVSQVQLDQFGLLQIAIQLPNKSSLTLTSPSSATYYFVKKLQIERVKDSGFHSQLIVGVR